MKRVTTTTDAAAAGAGAGGAGTTTATAAEAEEEVNNNINNTNNRRRPSNNNNNTNIRLLIHTVDGIIPYLTPNLLRQCFSVEMMQNKLMIGIPVRDTCVVPIYSKDDNKDTNKNKKLKGRQRKQNNPKGYEFSSSGQTIDSWILPYQRVTVPVFELHIDDHYYQRRQYHYHHHHGNKSNNKAKPVYDAVNNHGQLVCTPNGRVPLTTDKYYEIIAAATTTQQGLLNSSRVNTVVVPLFDMIPFHNLNDDRQKNNPYIKRKETAIIRCQQWLYDFVDQYYYAKKKKKNSSSSDGDDGGKEETIIVWAPVVVDQEGVVGLGGIDDDNDNNEYFRKQVDRVLSGRIKSTSTTTSSTTTPASSIVDASTLIKGVVVIGWERIDNSQKRQSTIRYVKDKLLQKQQQQQLQQGPSTTTSATSPPGIINTDIVVLSTHSLPQLLDAACGGCNVIGTDLPRQWAKSHKAFIVDFAGATANGATGGDVNKKSAEQQSKPKKVRLISNDDHDDHTSGEDCCAGVSLDKNGCIDLSSSMTNESMQQQQHPWFDDTKPMVVGCSCLACTTHSRAYIYHLICASELLGEIMLFIHNLHHCLELVRHFNTAHDNNDDQDNKEGKDLVEYIESQLPTNDS